MDQNIKYTFYFIGLLLLQVLVLNNVLFYGFINPYLYIAFIFLFPFKNNRFPILITSFLLGLLVDVFSNSGGIHAFSTLFIAFVRVYFFRFFFQKSEADYDFFDFNEESFGNVFNYVVTLTIIHHFILFSLTNFSFTNFSSVLINTISSTIFTLILYFLGNFIFNRAQ